MSAKTTQLPLKAKSSSRFPPAKRRLLREREYLRPKGVEAMISVDRRFETL